MWAHEWIILIGKRQEIKFHDFATFFPSSFTYINPYLFLLLSSLSSSSPKTTKCIIILYNTHTYSFNLTTQLNISPHELCPTWSVKQRWNYSKSTFINILYIHVFFFPLSFLWQAQRNERESIRQKLALGSFYDDEPVIYTSCSKNGPSSRWVWIECVCMSVLQFDQCSHLKASTNIFVF